MTEFELIKNYFATQQEHRSDVSVGIGDDAAVVSIPHDQELVLTTDTLVAGIHFPLSTPAFDIGYKSLAVNLSDLAAMGATPAWIMLSVTLPEPNEDWIQGFCDGFFTLANRFQVQLIGGDLSHGPLSITVQALGLVPAKQALRRSQAQAGDLIYVTGTLGDAGLALQFLQKKLEINTVYTHALLTRLNRPEPRIATGIKLRTLAHAAIDISDGFAADLNHILEQSHVGAKINVDQLPISEEVKHSVSTDQAISLALTSGDDYELCFTTPAAKRTELEKALATLPCRFTCVGEITPQPGLTFIHQNGTHFNVTTLGYEHF